MAKSNITEGNGFKRKLVRPRNVSWTEGPETDVDTGNDNTLSVIEAACVESVTDPNHTTEDGGGTCRK